MHAFFVEGGSPLYGTAAIHGAKNSILPILAASLLAQGECVIHNCPDLTDVTASVAILRHLGCRVVQEGSTVTVDSSVLTRCDVPDELMREMRSSVIFLGAVLARLGEASMCYPGGCELGPRPIDLHLAALRAMGAEIWEGPGGLRCTGAKMRGVEITLSMPSVGATENAMLAACGAEGTTVISNAAREPEIVDLQKFLLSMGANIRGAGTSVITVEGGVPLHGGEHTVMPDRIVACTYLAAAAAAGGEITVPGVDWRQISSVAAVLSEAGCILYSKSDQITLRRMSPIKAVGPIRTAPYPGFPTDAQAPVMAALCAARGTSIFVENMFESRYRHVDELRRMGADLRTEGKVAIVTGVPSLHGAAVRAADLRGGAALVVAALGAEGRSEITGLQHIDRGYQDLDAGLRSLGARIRRTSGNEMST